MGTVVTQWKKIVDATVGALDERSTAVADSIPARNEYLCDLH